MTVPGRLSYEVRIEGVLSESWAEWFGEATVTADGDQTVLRCGLPDEAALHGLLIKVHDLGIPLVSVRRVDDPEASPQVLPR